MRGANHHGPALLFFVLIFYAESVIFDNRSSGTTTFEHRVMTKEKLSEYEQQLVTLIAFIQNNCPCPPEWRYGYSNYLLEGSGMGESAFAVAALYPESADNDPVYRAFSTSGKGMNPWELTFIRRWILQYEVSQRIKDMQREQLLSWREHQWMAYDYVQARVRETAYPVGALVFKGTPQPGRAAVLLLQVSLIPTEVMLEIFKKGVRAAIDEASRDN